METEQVSISAEHKRIALFGFRDSITTQFGVA